MKITVTEKGNTKIVLTPKERDMLESICADKYEPSNNCKAAELEFAKKLFNEI